MTKRRLVPALLASSAALIMTGAQAMPAAAAGAAFADVGTCSRVGVELRYTAAPGVDNDVLVRRVGPFIVVSDGAGEVVPGNCTNFGDDARVNAGGIRRVRVLTLDGDDTVRITIGAAAILRGGAGEDELRGGPGDDDIRGGAGNDDLRGGAGVDQIRGEGDNDEIRGGDGDDDLLGGNGDDDVRGEGGNDEVAGNAGNDELFGGIGDDAINGGAGDDEMLGGPGNDQINGGQGTDTLNGGAGADDCNGGPGPETVTNCE
ncbi:calcium-binding protein [Thermopolyspora sp. NPDC052614]|uniref:calcium-binding protein n=1 Tax=Thermopolyspora sp. NPDC052614 TaxID=3155682 RepID=UPI00342A0A27